MNATEQQRYPLSWPTGWKRTPAGSRRHAAFHSTKREYYQGGGSYLRKQALSVGEGLDRLNGELSRLGARRVIISSNLRTRQDGMPHAQQARILDDPGVAVYFNLGGKSRVLACDKWASAAENLAAIAGHIHAIRAVDRYGVGTIDQAFAGYAALPADTAADWRSVFGFAADAVVSLADVESKYRERAKVSHPDRGGSDLEMAHVNRARDYARAELAG